MNCCPPGRRNYHTCVLLPLYIVSDLLLPTPLPKQMYSIYRQCVSGGGGGVALYCRPYSAGVLHSVSDQIRNLQNCYHHPKQKWPVKTTLRDWCLQSSIVHAWCERSSSCCRRQNRSRRSCSCSLICRRHSEICATSWADMLFLTTRPPQRSSLPPPHTR